MAKLLYITANPKTVDQSYSLSVGEAFLAAYKEANPQDEIIRVDCYQAGIPHIDPDVFSGWGKLQQGQAFDQLSADEKAKVQRMNELVDQFAAADRYVFATPLWNFSFPPIMKAYIDAICVAGKTFKYTDTGPVGLLQNKRAVHIQARGGIYSEGPAKEVENGDRHLRTVLNFLGITDIETIAVEGMAAMPQQADQIKQKAVSRAQETAKKFSNLASVKG